MINAGEVEKAVGVDEVLLVDGRAVVDEVFETCCSGVYMLVVAVALCGCEVVICELVG